MVEELKDSAGAAKDKEEETGTVLIKQTIKIWYQKSICYLFKSHLFYSY